MNLNITIDIESALAQAISPEKLQPIIDKHITDAITTAIRDATGYRSKFSETLKEQLSAALPHGLGVDDVAKFQHVLNKAVSEVVNVANSETVSAALKKAVQEVMPEVPAVIKLSELLKLARCGFHKEDHEEFYAFLEPSKYGGGGWLFLDEGEKPGDSSYSLSYGSRESRKYRAKYQIAFTEAGEVYALRLDGKQVTPSSRPDVIGEFDAIVMAMYVGRTRLDADIDDNEVEYAAQRKED